MGQGLLTRAYVLRTNLGVVPGGIFESFVKVSDQLTFIGRDGTGRLAYPGGMQMIFAASY